MFKTYNRKMLHIYKNKISDYWRINTFNIWQKINRKFLKTYSLIEDCGRCEDCGRNVHDFSAPDEIWNKVYGDDSGILCYDCFCNKADETLGFKWRMSLKENWTES
ncbi:MAG: hypothetical protein GX660_25695 [Clostridiaceae bacterium]|nr:hypothetical protein [Clostridiaceae bacterium]